VKCAGVSDGCDHERRGKGAEPGPPHGPVGRMLDDPNKWRLIRHPTTIRRPADSDDGARQPAESR